MTRIDAHQHFWVYDAREYAWIGDGMEALRRDFLPDDLAPELAACGVDGTIAVQARQSLEETRFLLRLARESEVVRAVVGWVDLRDPAVGETLGELARDPHLVGVRHVVQDEPEDDFVLRADFQRGIAALGRTELVYDILTYPRQLAPSIRLVDAFPDQAFVLDHLSKPFIARRELEPWASELRELAKRPNVACKLSGMVTEADWSAWRRDDFRPYLDVALAAFGPDRILFGSDWPVCLLSAPYADVHGIVADWAAELAEGERERLFGGNAVRIYRLRP